MDYDELWPDGPKFIHSEDALPLGTDALLLAAFAHGGEEKTMLDLGCGSGILSLLAAWKKPKLRILAVDINPLAVSLAERNFALNGLSDRVSAFCGDLRNYREWGEAGSFDAVICNPPYFQVDSGLPQTEQGERKARSEADCTLSDVCRAAAYLLRFGGQFWLTQRPERLTDVLAGLRSNSCEPKRLRFAHTRFDLGPFLVLIEGRRGGKPGLSVESPFLIYGPGGTETEEFRQICHQEKAVQSPDPFHTA